MGLFWMLIPEEYGGLGLDSVSYVIAVEELSRGWMSLAGVINSHLMPAHMIWKFATLEGLQIHAGYGYAENFAVERYCRDTKLLTVGQGTNEIQRLVIARRLLEHDKI
jgi:alkylation response protein AidB-like acyl-CoA dehydrogenase